MRMQPANNSLDRAGDAAPIARDNEERGVRKVCEGVGPGRSARSR